MFHRITTKLSTKYKHLCKKRKLIIWKCWLFKRSVLHTRNVRIKSIYFLKKTRWLTISINNFHSVTRRSEVFFFIWKPQTTFSRLVQQLIMKINTMSNVDNSRKNNTSSRFPLSRSTSSAEKRGEKMSKQTMTKSKQKNRSVPVIKPLYVNINKLFGTFWKKLDCDPKTKRSPVNSIKRNHPGNEPRKASWIFIFHERRVESIKRNAHASVNNKHIVCSVCVCVNTTRYDDDDEYWSA